MDFFVLYYNQLIKLNPIKKKSKTVRGKNYEEICL